MQLEGKIALITGAGHRLGKTIALALANEGCHLMIHFHQSQAHAAETATPSRIDRRSSCPWFRPIFPLSRGCLKHSAPSTLRMAESICW